MSALKIRVAVPGDIPMIQNMAQLVFRETYAELISPEQMEFMLVWMYSDKSLRDQITAPGKTFFIATIDSVQVGYASIERQGVTDDGRPLYHLQKLYLLPDYQGKGHGRQLFNLVAASILEESPDGARVELNVNRGNKAVGFYEAIGMTRDREGDFPIGNGFYMTDYIYVKDLSQGKPVCRHNQSIDCPCPKDCPRHGKCCLCVAHHREHGKLPACLR